MSKVNKIFSDYIVFEYSSKDEIIGEIIKSGLTKEQAKELQIKLGQGHLYSRLEIFNEIKNKTINGN